MRRKRADIRVASVLAALAAVGVLLAGAVAMSGCGASATLDPIARAAEISSQEPGAHIVMTMQLSGASLPGGGYAITANGWFDNKDHNGEMTMDMSQVPGISALPGNGQMQMVLLYPTVYMNMPFLAGKLPEGKTWMKLDITKLAQAEGVNISSFSSMEQSDPTQYLSYLRASAGSVVKLGQQTVDGVSTTHYSATLQLSRILEHLSGATQAAVKSMIEKLGSSATIPAEVWIDAQGRVRRMQLLVSDLPGAAGASMSITADFTSYGPAPAIVAPPASEVFDASSLVSAGLQGVGGAGEEG
jgi:hypothetical protein